MPFFKGAKAEVRITDSQMIDVHGDFHNQDHSIHYIGNESNNNTTHNVRDSNNNSSVGWRINENTQNTHTSSRTMSGIYNPSTGNTTPLRPSQTAQARTGSDATRLREGPSLRQDGGLGNRGPSHDVNGRHLIDIGGSYQRHQTNQLGATSVHIPPQGLQPQPQHVLPTTQLQPSPSDPSQSAQHGANVGLNQSTKSGRKGRRA